MRSRLLFSLLCLLAVASAAVAIWRPYAAHWIAAGCAIFSLLLLCLLWKSVLKANQVVMTGMELIASQDFNNRLSRTGLHDPDKIVNLFNTMIDKLRGERTKNLEQENFTQLLTKASPMGVMMLDFDRRVNMVNPAFLKTVGIDKEDSVLGKKAEEIRTSLVKEMIKTPLGKSGIISDGNVMMYRCYHLCFVQSGFRREFYLLESLTDEVIKAERAAYEKVIRTISHEVNNTIGGVRSVIQAIADTAEGDDMQEVLESCDLRCEQMCAFVSSYADVVRLPEPMFQQVDLNEEIGHLIPFLRQILREGVSLEFLPHDKPVNVRIDTNMIQQVVVNIVKNANESISATHGKIAISTSSEPGAPHLEIANDGDPIGEETARNLFRPFYTTKREGRGIGLTLTAEILNRHDARFHLRTGTDSVTRFQISF